jgi:CHAT domain-containing protein
VAFLAERRPAPGLNAVQARLGSHRVLLEYFLGLDDACIFAVRGGASRFFHLPGIAADVRSSAKTLSELVLRGRFAPGDTLWKGPARFLYRCLVGAIDEAGFLQPGDHIIVSPQGSVHDIPFAMLIDATGRLLIEQHIVSYVRSAGDIPGSGAGDIPTRMLALVPDRVSLPFAEQEIKAVPEKLFADRTILFDDDAGLSTFLQHATPSTFIHIAAHGETNHWDPLFSRLFLADKPLELHQIFSLHLDHSVVILSSCETGYAIGASGDISHGHEVVSFPLAFLQAGASAVISPMWVVEDEATSHLMRLFYTYLSRLPEGKRSLAAALAGAQRDLAFARAPFPHHPFYWAGFYLINGSR